MKVRHVMGRHHGHRRRWVAVLLVAILPTIVAHAASAQSPTLEAIESTSPSASQVVTSPAPAVDPAAYLLEGIPASVRDSCVPRTTRLVPGTIAAFDCTAEARPILRMAYYLLRPDDAQAVFDDRMAEYGLGPGGACASGTPGIEQRVDATSSGCYVDELDRANLRFAATATCPAVYWAVLGRSDDIARLTTAYERVVGGPWLDPGLGGSPEAPGCTGPIPAVAPPGPPRNAHATWESLPSRLDDAERAACEAAGLDIFEGIGTCEVADIRWDPGAGRTDGYRVEEAGTCEDSVAGTRRTRRVPYRTHIADVAADAELRVLYAVRSEGLSVCDGHLEVVALNPAGSAAAWVSEDRG